jgi:hypothetical protein
LSPRSYRDPVQNGHVAEDKLKVQFRLKIFFDIRKIHVGRGGKNGLECLVATLQK